MCHLFFPIKCTIFFGFLSDVVEVNYLKLSLYFAFCKNVADEKFVYLFINLFIFIYLFICHTKNKLRYKYEQSKIIELHWWQGGLKRILKKRLITRSKTLGDILK